MISLEFERLDGMKDVDPLVKSHLLTDDPAGAEESTLTGSINAVDEDGRLSRVGVSALR